jgi:hypothetical protein
VKGGGVGKKKSATPKTPKEMKNPKTHFTAKINQLNKAIAKATDNEIDAIDRINRHRDVLQQTNNKVCRDFINLHQPSMTARRQRASTSPSRRIFSWCARDCVERGKNGGDTPILAIMDTKTRKHYYPKLSYFVKY